MTKSGLVVGAVFITTVLCTPLCGKFVSFIQNNVFFVLLNFLINVNLIKTKRFCFLPLTATGKPVISLNMFLELSLCHKLHVSITPISMHRNGVNF